MCRHGTVACVHSFVGDHRPVVLALDCTQARMRLAQACHKNRLPFHTLCLSESLSLCVSVCPCVRASACVYFVCWCCLFCLFVFWLVGLFLLCRRDVGRHHRLFRFDMSGSPRSSTRESFSQRSPSLAVLIAQEVRLQAGHSRSPREMIFERICAGENETHGDHVVLFVRRSFAHGVLFV